MGPGLKSSTLCYLPYCILVLKGPLACKGSFSEGPTELHWGGSRRKASFHNLLGYCTADPFLCGLGIVSIVRSHGPYLHCWNPKNDCAEIPAEGNILATAHNLQIKSNQKDLLGSYLSPSFLCRFQMPPFKTSQPSSKLTVQPFYKKLKIFYGSIFVLVAAYRICSLGKKGVSSVATDTVSCYIEFVHTRSSARSLVELRKPVGGSLSKDGAAGRFERQGLRRKPIGKL